MKKWLGIAAVLAAYICVYSWVSIQAAPQGGGERPALGNKVLCPVMGTEVSPTETTPKMEYKGKVYYFCCPGCLQKFSKDPEKYTAGQDGADKPKMCSACKCGCKEGDKCDCGKDCECGCKEGAKCDCVKGCKCGAKEGAKCSCGKDCKCGAKEGAKCGCGKHRKCGDDKK